MVSQGGNLLPMVAVAAQPGAEWWEHNRSKSRRNTGDQMFATEKGVGRLHVPASQAVGVREDTNEGHKISFDALGMHL